jgi:uncharacterized protein (TIGR02391 family)
MPKKQTPQRRPADLRPEQMRDALPRIGKRLAELRAVEIDRVTSSGDPDIAALEQKIVSTLSDIFGADTIEFEQFGDIRLYPGGGIYFGELPSVHEVRQTYREGVAQTVSSLEAIISLFEEKLGVGDVDSSSRARRHFADLDLHTEISRVAANLFQDGHYANAIEDACKALDGLVKIRSGRFDLSGTDLMMKVFSPNAPILKFNELQSESDKSEQQGRMFLFAGAMLAVRNPRAHGIVEDDAENALDYIAFLSLLAKMVDEAKKV